MTVEPALKNGIVVNCNGCGVDVKKSGVTPNVGAEDGVVVGNPNVVFLPNKELFNFCRTALRDPNLTLGLNKDVFVSSSIDLLNDGTVVLAEVVLATVVVVVVEVVVEVMVVVLVS